ncbi:hypothetical protein AB0E08_47650 [Streptomyces sp. NPDC048281]
MIRATSRLGRLVKALAAEPAPAPPSRTPTVIRRLHAALACRPPRT